MTVPASTRRAGPYAGNGSTTAFPFSFKVFTSADLAVKSSTAGTETTLTEGTHYTVALNPDQDALPGGTVTMLTAPASGTILAIVGDMTLDQETDLPTGGKYQAGVVENALDKLTIIAQQNAELLDRALTLPATAAGADTTLPVPAASNVIGWDSAGTALVNFSPEVFASVVAYANRRVLVANGGAASYALATNPGNAQNCLVVVSGVVQTPGVDYTVSGTTLTPTSVWPSGTGNVAIVYGEALPVGTQASDNVTHSESTAYTGATVAAALARREVVVDTIAALKALPKTGTTRVFVAGYYAAGDGGGGHYCYDSADTTSADNGGTVIVASDGGRWKLVYSGFLSVKQFGAYSDGSNASATTAAVLACVAAARTVQTRDWIRPKIYFPGGPTAVYTLNQPIVNDKYPIHFCGDGPILFNNTTDLFRIGSGSSPGPEYGLPTIIEGLALTAFPTAGENYLFAATNSGIRLIDSALARVRDCTILGFGKGIHHDGSLLVEVDNTQFRNNKVACYARAGTGGPMSAANMHIYRGCRWAFNEQIANYVTGAVWIEHADFETNNPNNTPGLTAMVFSNMGGIAANAALHMMDIDIEGQTYQTFLAFSGADANKTISLTDYRDHSTSGTQISVGAGRVVWNNVTLANATTNGYALASGVTGLIIEGTFGGAAPSSGDSWKGITHIVGGRVIQGGASGGITGVESQSVTYDGASKYGTTYKTTSVTNDGYAARYYNPAGTQVGSIYQSNTATAFNTSSDARLKRDISAFAGSGAIIDGTAIRTYEWLSDNTRDVGAMAQQVHEVFPAAVHAGGDDPHAEPWQINWVKFIPVLVAEVQDLRRRLAAAGL